MAMTVADATKYILFMAEYCGVIGKDVVFLLGLSSCPSFLVLLFLVTARSVKVSYLK